MQLDLTGETALIKAVHPIDHCMVAFTGMEGPIMHALCHLTQLHKRNPAVHWILRATAKVGRAALRLDRKWWTCEYIFAQPAATLVPVRKDQTPWGPWRPGQLFLVKSLWSLCLSVFNRPIKIQGPHDGPQWEAPGRHLQTLLQQAGLLQHCTSATLHVCNRKWSLPAERDKVWPHFSVSLMIVFACSTQYEHLQQTQKHRKAHLPLMSARMALDLLELIRSKMGPCRSCPCVRMSGCYRAAGHLGSGRCFAPHF